MSEIHNHDSCEHGCCCTEHDEPFFTPLNIVGIAIFAIGFYIEHFMGAAWWISFVILLAAYLIIGWRVLVMAGGNIIRGKVFDENFLMCVASIGAFIIGEHSEAVAVMLFYMVGEYFQGKAVNRSRSSIRALMDIRPDTAWVVTQDAVVETPCEEVAVGSMIEIRPGDRIPLDAVVVSGCGDIDMKALTGESLPVDVSEGSELLAGGVNGRALIRAKVTKPFAESTASKIIELAENASERKAPAENFITRFARIYTPIVVACAAGIAVLPPLVGAGSWADWVMRGLVFLVVSCPCALVISIPISYFGGIGGASARGILVKGGNYLNALAGIGAVVFDKTGTLTKGAFRVVRISAADGFTESVLLRYAAAAESASTHPIAISIVRRYRERADGKVYGDGYKGSSSESGSQNFMLPPVTKIVEEAGYGVHAVVGGDAVVCGSAGLIEKEGLSAGMLSASEMSGTSVHVAVAGKYAGCIIVADEPKPDSAEAVAGLRECGVKRIAMLTGDSAQVAQEVAGTLGIDEVYAELLPGKKVEILEKIMGAETILGKSSSEIMDSATIGSDHMTATRRGRIRSLSSSAPVAVVGDGINDAPMLARADIGIAMGGLGSDAAVESADIVIMNDSPKAIVTAVEIARKTRRIVAQNIVLALGVKCAVMILSAFGAANMWEAVFADVGVALIAVLNATRARG